jgi:ABC-type multidrug transport system permease subunit
MDNMRQLPRFWIWMQIVIVVCVLISAVIVVIRL